MKKILGVVMVIALLSCNNVKKPKKPDNLISQKDMVNILLDISLLKSSEGVSKAKLENNGYTSESYIFKRHNIDSVQFALSNEYYSYDLNTYLEIYQKVEDSLKKLKTYYEEKKQDEIQDKKRKDSIKKLRPNDKIQPEKKQRDSMKLIDPVNSSNPEEQPLETF